MQRVSDIGAVIIIITSEIKLWVSIDCKSLLQNFLLWVELIYFSSQILFPIPCLLQYRMIVLSSGYECDIDSLYGKLFLLSPLCRVFHNSIFTLSRCKTSIGMHKQYWDPLVMLKTSHKSVRHRNFLQLVCSFSLA